MDTFLNMCERLEKEIVQCSPSYFVYKLCFMEIDNVEKNWISIILKKSFLQAFETWNSAYFQLHANFQILLNAIKEERWVNYAVKTHPTVEDLLSSIRY